MQPVALDAARKRAHVHPQDDMQNQHGDDGQELDYRRAELVGDDRGESSSRGRRHQELG